MSILIKQLRLHSVIITAIATGAVAIAGVAATGTCTPPPIAPVGTATTPIPTTTSAVTSSASSTPELAEVSAAALDRAGVQMSPSAASTKTGREDAIAEALRQSPGAQIRGAALEDFQDSDHSPAIHCVCWVVSVIPSWGLRHPSGPAGVSIPASFYIIVVDGTSGQFLEGLIE